MSVRDRLDDREAEPDPLGDVRRTSGEPPERLEETRNLTGRDERAAVRDRETGVPGGGVGSDLDPATDDIVADRVRDEVGDETLEQIRVTGRPGRFQHGHELEPAGIVSLQRVGRDDREIDRLAPLEPTLAPGEHETGFEQPLLPPARRENVRADLPPESHIRIRVGEGQLEQRALGREGSA